MQRLVLPIKAEPDKPIPLKKLTGGGGLSWSMRTTRDSTFGGGRKLRPTLRHCFTSARSWVFTESLQYIASPGRAVSLMRIPLGTCSTPESRAVCEQLENQWRRYLVRNITTQTSIRKVDFDGITVNYSQMRLILCSLHLLQSFGNHPRIELYCNDLFCCCSSCTVIMPVPGPISSTTSVDLTAAFEMILTTSAERRKCWPLPPLALWVMVRCRARAVSSSLCFRHT